MACETNGERKDLSTPYYLMGLLEGLLGWCTWRQERRALLSQQQQSLTSSVSTCLSTCHLCLEQRAFPALLPCGHFFCWSCVCQLTLTSCLACPLCRAPFSMHQVYCIESIL